MVAATPCSPVIQGILVDGVPTNGFVVGDKGTLTVTGQCLDNASLVSFTSVPGLSVTGPFTVSPVAGATVVGLEQFTGSYTVDPSSSASLGYMNVLTPNGTGLYSPVAVAPSLPYITQITPYPWQSGSSFQFLIYGAGFGTTPVTLSINGTGIGAGSYSYTNCFAGGCSDSVIAGTVVIPADAVIGDQATVTVGSGGYGNGFQNGAGGQGGSSSATVPILGAGEPTLSVTVGGAPVSPNSIVYISPVPQFPALVATLIPAAGQTLSSAVSWQFVATYNSPVDPIKKTYVTYTCTAPGSGPRVLAANVPWNIANEGPNLICGGNVIISYTYGAYSRQFSFNIWGQNPALGTVKALLNSYAWQNMPAPWFLFQLVNHESQFHQFNAGNVRTSQPNWGPPQGFGIMQLDPPDTVFQIFDWTQNVPEGERRLDQIYGPPSAPAWNQQLQLWAAWNEQYPQATYPPPPPISQGTCTFQYPPTGVAHPFSDAIWMGFYNTGPGGTPYITFNPNLAANGWASGGAAYNYVGLVCQTPAP